MPHHVRLLEVPDESSPTLKLLATDLAVELGGVGLHAAHVVILHTVHGRTLELTLLAGTQQTGKTRLTSRKSKSDDTYMYLHSSMYIISGKN